MESLICSLLILWCYLSGYLVSLYALAFYIDPEDLPRLMPQISARRQRALMRLVDDPRAFVQVATIYRYCVLIVVTACTISLVGRIGGPGISVLWYTPPLVIVWLVFILSVEFLPRRNWRKDVSPAMIRYLWLINIFYLILAPVVFAYRRALIRSDQGNPVTEEEKEEIVERAIETLAEQAGIGEAIVEEDEKEMIGQIFLLDQTLVREIMSPRIDIVALEKATPFSEIQDLVRRDGHSRYPVYEDSIDRVIGILYVKDLFTNMPRIGEEFVITDYLRQPFFVPEAKVIGELLREFLATKLHLAIVVDEYGGVAGLVTLEDIIEEIVGEIQDEHDSEPSEYKSLPDGGFEVDAGLRLDKLQELFDTEYEQDENATTGGLIYDLVGSVPAEGTKLRWNDLKFEVVKVEGQRIRSVRVTRPGY